MKTWCNEIVMNNSREYRKTWPEEYKNNFFLGVPIY